ncbi:ABC transporter ATP-binding protein [uncultured Bifidobacterium sp.]|uniref:ABC transporter ATP-binding protein n=1 Tax=uncultured Bifidobacterium sp. TaxID=165187 RepID=UPI0028DB2F76|nr:ABC transporter ATP-binding protein [uncultured Bifidobacterium sp.]
MADAQEPQISRNPDVDRRESGLTINRASKVFRSAEGKEVHAIDDVSLAICRGEFFVMLGPSGCGKTTLLRSIAGLETLDAGEIYLDDRKIDDLPPYERPVNTVFQSYALFPHMTVEQNIAFGLEMEHKPRKVIRKAVSDMLDLVHLSDIGARHPDQLSGGQQQRVALARALAKSPEVLLLDESLSALDFKLRRQMQVELKRIQRETGVTFVFVTHDQEEALSMADRIAVFSNGRPEQVGTPEQIYDEPVNRFVADFIGDINFIDGVKGRGDSVVLESSTFPVQQDLANLSEGEQVCVAVRPEHITLSAPGGGGLQGSITWLTFMGAHVRCSVRLDDGTELMARLAPSSFDVELRPEAKVTVVIGSEHMRVVER